LALTGLGRPDLGLDVSAEKSVTRQETERMLGLKGGTLEGPADEMARGDCIRF